MKKVYLDSDVILDALLENSEFYIPAANVIALAYEKQITAMTSPVIFVNVHYFLHKYAKANKFNLLRKLRSVVSIVEVGENIIDMALKSNLNDFEDAVQYFAAISNNADVILTRNIKDYKHFTIPVLTAEQFLGQL